MLSILPEATQWEVGLVGLQKSGDEPSSVTVWLTYPVGLELSFLFPTSIL